MCMTLWLSGHFQGICEVRLQRGNYQGGFTRVKKPQDAQDSLKVLVA